jgi:hypothetical protein
MQTAADMNRERRHNFQDAKRMGKEWRYGTIPVTYLSAAVRAFLAMNKRNTHLEQKENSHLITSSAFR